MAEFANRHRKDVVFEVGDKVFLRLQPCLQHSVGRPLSAKLSRRFYGQFVITKRIGAVAYRLQLQVDSKVHDVFHMSLLRPFVPPFPAAVDASLLAQFHNGRPIDTPVRASDSRVVLVDKLPQEQWLIHWSSDPSISPSWEPMEVLRRHFPHLNLEDKAAAMEGRVDRDLPINDNQPLTADDQQPMIGMQSDEDEPKSEREEAGPTRNERPKRNVGQPARYADYVMR